MEGKGKGKKVIAYLIGKASIKKLFEAILLDYKVFAPKLKDGFISYDWVRSFADLPLGYRNYEGPGFYSLERVDGGYFTYTHPIDSFKKLLRPPEEVLMVVRKGENGIVFEESLEPLEKVAIFDIRSCDLDAMKVLDKVYMDSNHPDAHYSVRRKDLFIVGVNCSYATQTCFCSYMSAGPHIREGYDLCLTELEDAFLVEVGTEKGMQVLNTLELVEAKEEHLEKKKELEEEVKRMMQKGVDTHGLKEKLYANMDIENFQDVGKRCLACTSCTQVCPTCFCFDIVEKNSLDGDTSERVRLWDSCFSPSFATVHKYNLRESVASRYRQWMMHKFAYWLDQFGSFGCVGCGRCITWCPVGIDIREEVNYVANAQSLRD